GGELRVASGLFFSPALSLSLTAGEVIVNLSGMSVPYHHWAEETRFVFDKGHVAVLTPAPMHRQASARVQVYRGYGPLPAANELMAEVDWSFRRQARGFVAALLGQAPLLAPGDDCLHDVAILEDVMRKTTFA